MTIIVSGASGDLGSRITSVLMALIDPSELVLLSRNPDNLSDAASKGATVRKADFNNTVELVDALTGGDIFLLISTLSIGRRAEQHSNAISAAKKAGISHIIYTSSMGIQPNTPSISGLEHYATEELLRTCGLKYTIMRNSWYADVIPMLMLKHSMDMGGFVASTGGGHVAPVAKQDCANVAAAILVNPDKHENCVYEITGPDLMTFADIAQKCSEVVGQDIPYTNVSHDEKLAIFDAMGASREYEEGMMNDNTAAWASNEMITYEMAIKQHYFSICSHHVELITGKAATSFVDVVESYRGFWE